MKIQLKDHLCFRLYVASRLIVQGYGEALKNAGLTYPKYIALLALEERDGQTVRDLGRTLKLDSGTLSPLLKSLLREGYVERRREESDERVVLNFITPKGKKAAQEGRRIAYHLFEETKLSEARFIKLRGEMNDFVKRCERILRKQRRGRSPGQVIPNRKESPWSRHVH